MSYRLASRENINSNKFDLWPAVLDNTFTKFNNKIEPFIFNTESELMCWLDSKCNSKNQELKNSDPNKLYSVYICEHNDKIYHNNNENGLIDTFLYSLCIKKSNEAFITYSNNKGGRVKSSFKKIDSKIEFINADNSIEYSSDVRLINGEFYEGIYPIDEDENDITHSGYLNYIKTIHVSDINENVGDKEFLIVYADCGYVGRWIDKFTKKLEILQLYLEFFARGGDIYVNIKKDDEHDMMVKHILKTLSDNRLDTFEDNNAQLNIKNTVIDPFLYDGNIYQIRFQKTLLNWHKDYVYLIKKLGLMPSKQFADTVMNFSLMDFFKQYQSRDNLKAIIKNIENVYGITGKKEDNVIRAIGRIQPGIQKFHKVVKSFNIN